MAKTSISMTKDLAAKAQESFLCRNDLPKHYGGGVSEFVEIAVKFTLEAAAQSDKDRQKVIDFFSQAHEEAMREKVQALVSQYSIENKLPKPEAKKGKSKRASSKAKKGK